MRLVTHRITPLGDSPLLHRLARSLPGLAQRLVRRLADEVPVYGRLPAEELADDITTITGYSLQLALRVAREGRLPAPEELAEITASAARRAQERIPLPALLTAYHSVARMVWQDMVAEAGPEELPDIVAVSDLLMGWLQVITAAVSAAYLEEWDTVVDTERQSHRAMLAALLRGDPGVEGYGLGDLPAPLHYRVLALAVDPGPDAPGVDGAIAARRRVRRLHAALEQYSGTPVLTALEPAGGLVLLPIPAGRRDPAPRTGQPDRAPRASQLHQAHRSSQHGLASQADPEGLAGLLPRLTEAAGAPVTAAVATAAPAQVKDAAQQTREVLDVVRQFGKPPGLYRLADVLLEYQLTRDTPARAELAALLSPLDTKRELLETLSVFVEQQLNRRRTASVLHLHPNTVDYRLRRAAELTGLNPTTPADLHQIVAALAARRSLRPGP